MTEIHALFVMGFIAVLVPLLRRMPAFARMPEVVLELMLGILIGPSVLGLVTSQGAIGGVRVQPGGNRRRAAPAWRDGLARGLCIQRAFHRISHPYRNIALTRADRAHPEPRLVRGGSF